MHMESKNICTLTHHMNIRKMFQSSRHHQAKVRPQGCCQDIQSSDTGEVESSRPQGRERL